MWLRAPIEGRRFKMEFQNKKTSEYSFESNSATTTGGEEHKVGNTRKKTKVGDPTAQDVTGSTSTTVPTLLEKEVSNISLLTYRQGHTLPRTNVDLRCSKEVHTEVPHMAAREGDKRRKLFLPSPQILLDLSPDKGPMILNPKKQPNLPKTNVGPESSEPLCPYKWLAQNDHAN